MIAIAVIEFVSGVGFWVFRICSRYIFGEVWDSQKLGVMRLPRRAHGN